MTRIDGKALAILLRRAGLPATKKRMGDLIDPARYIEAAGRRLSSADTAKLSPVGKLWKRHHD